MRKVWDKDQLALRRRMWVPFSRDRELLSQLAPTEASAEIMAMIGELAEDEFGEVVCTECRKRGMCNPCALQVARASSRRCKRALIRALRRGAPPAWFLTPTYDEEAYAELHRRAARYEMMSFAQQRVYRELGARAPRWYRDCVRREMANDMHNFVGRVRKAAGCNAFDVQYYCAFEYGGERGREHMHLVLVLTGPMVVVSKRTIERLWIKGAVTRPRNIRLTEKGEGALAGYMAKAASSYLAKADEGNAEWFPLGLPLVSQNMGKPEHDDRLDAYCSARVAEAVRIARVVAELTEALRLRDPVKWGRLHPDYEIGIACNPWRYEVVRRPVRISVYALRGVWPEEALFPSQPRWPEGEEEPFSSIARRSVCRGYGVMWAEVRRCLRALNGVEKRGVGGPRGPPAPVFSEAERLDLRKLGVSPAQLGLEAKKAAVDWRFRDYGGADPLAALPRSFLYQQGMVDTPF